MKKIGERIRDARFAKNLTREELAELIGAKYRSVSTWECGTAKPDCVTLLRICKTLDVSPDLLLGFDSETPTTEEWSLLTKYRYIDDYGKKAVDSILSIEYERTIAIKGKKPKDNSRFTSITSPLLPEQVISLKPRLPKKFMFVIPKKLKTLTM